MRLFIAVAADEEVRAEAAAAVARLKRAPGDFRWVDPRDMHVTLRYYGERPEADIPGIEASMRAAAAQAKPFELVYGKVGAFDSYENPRVVWIGVREGTEALKGIAQSLARDDERPYSPHLTIGRNRRETVEPGFVAALRAETDIALKQSVTKLSLYASRPAPFGHAYEILSEAPLG